VIPVVHRFQGVQVSADDEYGDGTLMDEVLQLMLRAQQAAPEDADVLVNYLRIAYCDADNIRRTDSTWSAVQRHKRSGRGNRLFCTGTCPAHALNYAVESRSFTPFG
jgi:hypothetical protein